MAVLGDLAAMLVEEHHLAVERATEVIVDMVGMDSVVIRVEVMVDIVVPVGMREERAVVELPQEAALVVEAEEAI